MKQALRILATFFVLPCAAATASLLIVFQLVVKPTHFDAADETDWFRDALRLMSERHVDGPSSETLVFEAIRGMTNSADSYSDFIDPYEYARFREENEGQYVGIGFVVYNEGPPVTVLYPFENSPAKAAGLQPGDRIIAVDGVDCTGLSHDDVIGRIKLENGEGKSVRLTVRRWTEPDQPVAEPIELEVVRDNIERDSVFDAHLVDPAAGIGYARIAAFQEHTAKELGAALKRLADECRAQDSTLRAVVLDLRRNRGGLLDQAVDAASLFLNPGETVVLTEGRTDDANQTYAATAAAGRFSDLKLAILTDRSTASASEVLAGALQDHLRAVLVGQQTFGKGMVQSVIPRRYVIDGEERLALIKITTSRYVTPSGRAIDKHKGLTPDVFAALPSEVDRLLDRHFQDREIPAETWRLIEERTGYRPLGADFQDGVLEKAVEVLAGEKVFNPVS